MHVAGARGSCPGRCKLWVPASYTKDNTFGGITCAWCVLIIFLSIYLALVCGTSNLAFLLAQVPCHSVPWVVLAVLSYWRRQALFVAATACGLPYSWTRSVHLDKVCRCLGLPRQYLHFASPVRVQVQPRYSSPISAHLSLRWPYRGFSVAGGR